MKTTNKFLFLEHTYCLFLISHNAIIDITDFSVEKYSTVLSYFDGYEIAIYTKDLSMVSRRYVNPAHAGDYVTAENLNEWLKECRAKNPHGTKSTVSFTREVTFTDVQDMLTKNVAFCKSCKSCKLWGCCHRN